MISRCGFWFLLLALAIGTSSLKGCQAVAYEKGDYGDPERFEKAINQFEAQDAKRMPAQGAIVCVGSSSMRMWNGRLASDLEPLTVIPRGFGGSNMYDTLHYADQIVIKYKPRAVLLYEGDNDIAQGIEPSHIEATFQALVKKIHQADRDIRVYVLAIKPSPKRWGMWGEMKQANALLLKACAKDERLVYIDIATPMLGDDGSPREELFIKDRLHMNDAGYDVWRGVVRPVLIEAERRFEVD